MNSNGGGVRKRSLKKSRTFGFGDVYINVGTDEEPELRKMNLFVDPSGFLKAEWDAENAKPFVPDQLKEKSNAAQRAMVASTIDQA